MNFKGLLRAEGRRGYFFSLGAGIWAVADHHSSFQVLEGPPSIMPETRGVGRGVGTVLALARSMPGGARDRRVHVMYTCHVCMSYV